MMDNIDDIRAFYDSSECGENFRLARYQLERDITRRYFEAYLPPTGRILEIGAATGAYTLWLAQRGYHVTAIDLSESQINECRKRVSELGLQTNVDCLAADARDLAPVSERDFDAVLLMGPLYHLVLSDDRLKALREAVACLKRGGLLFSALISRFGIMGHLLQRVPQWIENQKEVRSLIERGRDPEDAHTGGFRGYYATVDEIAPLHEELGLEPMVLAGVEPAISADDDSYNRLEGEQREHWLELLYELSREPSLIAGSRHLLYIGRKPEQ